jgi:hypothetical protein
VGGRLARDTLAQRAVLTHEQYQQAIWDIRSSEAVANAGRLDSDVVTTAYGADECSDKVRLFQGEMVSVLQQVQDLEPPAEASDAQREFLEAAQESVRLVGVAADDAGMGRLSCGPALNGRIYGMPSTARADAALAKLEVRGYGVLGK